MSACSKMMLVVLTLAFSISPSEGADPAKVDLTKRQTGISDRRAPVKMKELDVNDQFIDKRFPIKEWHGEYNSLGRRRSSIDARETREKNITRPQVIEMERVERKMAPMNRRQAFIRNFDQIQENQKVPEYRDATVVNVREMSIPAPTNSKEGKNPSMRDINRFSFQRNHSDAEGVSIKKAGSSEQK